MWIYLSIFYIGNEHEGTLLNTKLISVAQCVRELYFNQSMSIRIHLCIQTLLLFDSFYWHNIGWKFHLYLMECIN